MLPLIEFAADARRTGRPTRELSRSVARGDAVRVRRGAYVEAAGWQDLEPRLKHLATMAAMCRASSRTLVFSHESGAAVWGMPVLDGWPAAPHVTEAAVSGRRTDAVSVRHIRDLDPAEIAVAGGFRATDPIRTAIDLAAARSLGAGVAAIDHLLADPATRDLRLRELTRRVRDRRPFRGVRRVDAALAIASGVSESPLESLSLARFAELGIPLPEQQCEIASADGRTYRVDFLWRDRRVIGEADGRLKYLGADDLWHEKRREDALRAVGYRVVRWGWQDAASPRALRDILGRAGIR
jgi:hypothetical protein